MSDYNSKLSIVENLLKEYNESNKEFPVLFGDFKKELRKAGGIDEEALRLVSWEDLMKMGLPLLIAKKAADIFRDKTDKKNIYSDKKVSGMSYNELVEAYNPENTTNNVAERLKKLSNNQKFLVFSSGTLNTQLSSKLLKELIDGYPERQTFISNDKKPVLVYRVGDRPGNFLTENPLFIGQYLRPDGTCTITDFNWNEISDTIKHILFLATHQTKECKIEDRFDGIDLLDKLFSFKDEKAEERTRNRFIRASVLYDEMKVAGNLPSLTVLKSNIPNNTNTKLNDPFRLHKKF